MNRTQAFIDLKHYGDNVRLIRSQLADKTRLLVAVKADGYGHGAVEIGKTALRFGANCLGVAWLQEALELRNAGISAPILLFSHTTDEIEKVVISDIIQTVYSFPYAEKLNACAKRLDRRVKVHLKVDTGMGRLGCLPEETVPLLKQLKQLDYLEVEGIFTHFAKADEPESDYTQTQFDLFSRLLDRIKAENIDIPLRHAANSGAVVHFPQTHLDMVRPGLMTYQDVLTLKSVVGFLKRVPANSYISYGGDYRTERSTVIATITVGYADGYPRALSNKGRVLIGGRSYPVCGRVCMDMLMVDLGDNPFGIEMGDEVVLIGSQGGAFIGLEEVAQLANKIPYEIMCGLGKRVPRIYLSTLN